jgi:polysaccharide export outer membrane protein
MHMSVLITNSLRCLIISLLAWGLVFCSQITPANKDTTEIPVDASYTIGPMDILDIQVWKEPDFSRQVLVRPDGQITMPLVGDLKASGMNTMDLTTLLTEKLADFIEKPEVTVSVVESRSKQFFIIGKVNRPGTYALTPGMTVLQALSVAGGFTEWADKDGIRIVRRGAETEQIFSFDYEKVISGKELGQNIVLMPNDTVIVP